MKIVIVGIGDIGRKVVDALQNGNDQTKISETKLMVPLLSE